MNKHALTPNPTPADETVGAYMSANYIALPQGASVREAMRRLVGQAAEYDNIATLFLIDDFGRLLGTLELKDRNLEAVKAGMLALTQEGSLARYFQDLDVKVGAKTGSAQVSATSKDSNAVLVCFAPYDDPEIALAIVAEKGGTGSELGAIAADIFRAYFNARATQETVNPENTLVQ